VSSIVIKLAFPAVRQQLREFGVGLGIKDRAYDRLVAARGPASRTSELA
jgi:hypothetical protein